MLKITAKLFLLFSLFLVGCSPGKGVVGVETSLPTLTQLITSPVLTEPPAQPLTSSLPSQATQPAVSSPAQLPTDPPPDSSPSVSPPSPGSSCQDGLEFVTDLTIPDGSLLGRGAQVDKRWQVQNTGTCSWDERYKLVQVLGPDLGLPNEQALYPGRSGAAAVIRMLLSTPLEPGVYTSAWQARSPSGDFFGDVIYIEFQVN